MTTKTELAKQAFLQGDWRGALRIMHTWTRGLTPQTREALQLGWNCLQSPRLYSQMGYDCEECIERAKNCIAEYFREEVDIECIDNT